MTPNNWRGEGREREHGEGDESETRARRGARMMRRGVGRAEGARGGGAVWGAVWGAGRRGGEKERTNRDGPCVCIWQKGKAAGNLFAQEVGDCDLRIQIIE